MQTPSSSTQYMIISFALCLAAVSTALASPLYAIYEQVWGITTSQVGYIFIAYMLGVVFSLLFLSKLNAIYNYKQVIVVSLSLSIIGMILSAFALSIWLLSFSRFLIGIASGLITTAAMVGLKDQYPFRNKMLSEKLTSMITILGFALGPLLGGILADHTHHPLADPYWIMAIFTGVVLFSVLWVQPKIQSEKKHKWIELLKVEGLILPQVASRKIFWICSISALCSFGAFSLYAALAGTFIRNLAIHSSATFTGFSISIILFVSVLSQLFCKSLKEMNVLSYGLAALLLGTISLVVAEIEHGMTFLFLSILFTGIGHGFSLSAAYYFIGKIIDLEKNPLIFSSYLFIAYQGTIWPVIFSSYLIEYMGLIVTLWLISILLMATIIWLIYQIKFKLKPLLVCHK
ncbi:MFS transporter [Acinetobacter sp. ANC 4633]|uniref:MFS transporter n=1 Tax=Acinetobacter sp. ANC 4633 TaxID=2529845 RepID=UPI00103E5F29|nr:MFS transporter [Acinetobacter sp. ANC 4633]TCB25395.1 MFS transporter [Acinetobacter sp. ANC 4633]